MIVCSPQLGLSPKSILGGEVFDREILIGLAKKGIKVEIILPKSKPHDEDIRYWHITYLPISRFPAQFFNFLLLPKLFKLRNKDIQILRLHQPQFEFIAAVFFKILKPKVKIVATYHKFEETNFGFLSKTVNNYWDHIICDSNYVMEKIKKEFGVAPQKITVVHNGVPTYLKPAPKDKTLVAKYGLERKFVLLFMGLFIDRKNPLFIIDVLAKLSKEEDKIILLFLGHGPLKEKMRAKAQKLGVLEKIRFIDPIFGAQKNYIHNLADIFVHPSKDEGFALAPLEAMACAKPIVITNGFSAQEAVVDKLNGFLCKPDDIDDWVAKISEIIRNPAQKAKMGQASHRKAKKEFQWKLATDKHIEVFKKLLK